MIVAIGLMVSCYCAARLPADAVRWLVEGYPWAWVLADPRPFERPVPFRGGQLGLFELPHDADGAVGVAGRGVRGQQGSWG